MFTLTLSYLIAHTYIYIYYLMHTISGYTGYYYEEAPLTQNKPPLPLHAISEYSHFCGDAAKEDVDESMVKSGLFCWLFGLLVNNVK